VSFLNHREIIRAVELGRMHLQFIHKTSTPTPGASRWADCSMGAGTPIYNAYVGGQLESTQLIGQKNQGIYTGPTPAAGQAKYLAQISLASPQTSNGAPYTVQVCDYLMFYPLVDGDSTDQQDMENLTSLPRYTSGAGVQLMLVCTTPMTASGDIQINVTTADDVDVTLTTSTTVSGTVGVVVNTAASNTAISSTAFVPLGPHRGIKRVNWITNQAALGGFYCAALVKPLTSMMLREPLTMTEQSLVMHKASLPRVFDGAYINFLLQASAAGTGNPGAIRGEFDFIWG
jgi:hypothetical protein